MDSCINLALWNTCKLGFSLPNLENMKTRVVRLRFADRAAPGSLSAHS